MQFKKGGGNHLQLFDQENGQYADEDKVKLNEKDLESLVMVHYFGFDNDEFIFHFPISGVHTDEYCDIFVSYLKRNSLFGEAFIEESKLKDYLFKFKEKDDKSKFMINVLGFSNNEGGWLRARNAILRGTDFSTAKYDPPMRNGLIINAETEILDKNGKKYNVLTSWQIKDDLSLRFVTLIPRRKNNV